MRPEIERQIAAAKDEGSLETAQAEGHNIKRESEQRCYAELEAATAAVMKLLDGEWQSERSTEGDWYLSFHPSQRRQLASVHDVMIDSEGGVWARSNYFGRLGDDIFTDAIWQRRTVPADPFKRGEG